MNCTYGLNSRRFSALGPFANSARTSFQKIYNYEHQNTYEKGGMAGEFALEAGMLMVLYPGKYDEALKEAGAYMLCISMFPEKYGLDKETSKKKKSKRK